MATQLEHYSPQSVGNRVERSSSRGALTPAVDILETNDEITLTADMPGVDEKSVDITLEQDVLTIEGRMPNEVLSDYSLGFREYSEGDYRRIFTLATGVDRDKIRAEVKDGVLKLSLPKAEPAKAKKITVKAG